MLNKRLYLALFGLLLIASTVLCKKEKKADDEEEVANEKAEEEEEEEAPNTKKVEDFPWGDAVKKADKDNFEDLLEASKDTKNGAALVMFYAPWCGHCQESKEPFQNAANEDEENTYIVMNCDDNQNFCWDLELKGYPTFKVYKDGEFVEDYLGMRTKSWFKKTAKKAEKKKEKKEEKKEEKKDKKKSKKSKDDEL